MLFPCKAYGQQLTPLRPLHSTGSEGLASRQNEQLGFSSTLFLFMTPLFVSMLYIFLLSPVSMIPKHVLHQGISLDQEVETTELDIRLHPSHLFRTCIVVSLMYFHSLNHCRNIYFLRIRRDPLFWQRHEIKNERRETRKGQNKLSYNRGRPKRNGDKTHRYSR